MTIKELQNQSWSMAKAKGFHLGRTDAGRDDTLIRLGLVMTEVAEAMQIVKKRWDPSDVDAVLREFALELADILIRVGDLAGCVGVDLDSAIMEKMTHNSQRPFQYGTPDERKP